MRSMESTCHSPCTCTPSPKQMSGKTSGSSSTSSSIRISYISAVESRTVRSPLLEDGKTHMPSWPRFVDRCVFKPSR
ncbi:hypothetical protein FOVG_19967 [Fusarium oxysporum f. sp. pisi HDV247]|uniref:Uncharacterized protein n=1 Tax=Fusarium oxysporum f. sp. pisi HDV247 TaxID=1080344 RepID=W9NCJ7_FUSOX|nr:hypothetical protein FOVG_19967 [Fusarium oxysporum f. sp. pisi HDV247]